MHNIRRGVAVLSEAAAEVEIVPTWAPDNQHDIRNDWQLVDHALRTIACRRAALDADEAHWLRQAEALQIWQPLGMVSALDYMERVLGYRPRSAQDRLRVARALGTLPQLTAALTHGELPFSAVRELTRVVTPATEAEWCEAATGKNLRQSEDLVAEHRPGDRPTDPPDPEARLRVVRFELSAETFARGRPARAVLDAEPGSPRSGGGFVAALSNTVLDGAAATESTGRAKYQIAVTVCERCRQGWQDGAGAKVAIGPAAVDRTECDAQYIGSLDGAAPDRAYQDVPPSVVRFVWRRDGGRCRVPGCRSARGLEVHHLVHRAEGGGHEPSNLVLACSSCHQAHHGGALTITGTADHLEVRRTADPSLIASGNAQVDASASDNAHVGAPTKLDAVIVRTQAKDAIATGAIASGNAHVGATASDNA